MARSRHQRRNAQNGPTAVSASSCSDQLHASEASAPSRSTSTYGPKVSKSEMSQHREKPAARGSEKVAFSAARDEAQVVRDVNRTTLNENQKRELSRKICQVLERQPQLYYYQGFHEISQHLETADELEVLALTRLRDFMSPDMIPTLRILDLIPELLLLADADLGRLARKIPTQSVIAPIITLFGHGVDLVHSGPRRLIERVQAHGLSHVLYLYLGMCIRMRSELLKAEAECLGDWSLLHAQMSKLHLRLSRYTERDLAELSLEALGLAQKYPLSALPSFKKISVHSALHEDCSLEQAIAHSSRWSSETVSPRPRRSNLRIILAVTLVIVSLAVNKRR